MDIYGLIGYPLGHSFSKSHFENMFNNEGIEASFLNFEIDNLNKLQKIINTYQSIKGLSVTIPYKQDIIPFLDLISKEAKAIGAVNSIRITRNNNKIICKGFNTDVYGFKISFLHLIGSNRSKALILGSGGAAKAIKYTLNELGIEYLEVSRTPTHKQISYNEISSIIKNYKIIINTTPLGMFPNTNSCPDIPYQKLNSSYYLFDLTYNPEITTFMKKGIENKANVKNGLEMLHLQAQKSWSLWNTHNI